MMFLVWLVYGSAGLLSLLRGLCRGIVIYGLLVWALVLLAVVFSALVE